ncbi:hypothetical protein OHA01_09930 [Micromonospora zamorensis]|uniref:hypothetical protein n=1 Tax=Micromonospora zamorensis TaxID=709883 RepID=UPI003866955A|nr:hypothetical protein OHA01_09930 [Micromonospora zamorensis]
MADHALLASGRDADVYVLDESRVLRRYRQGGDSAPEAALMAYVGLSGVAAARRRASYRAGPATVYCFQATYLGVISIPLRYIALRAVHPPLSSLPALDS